MGPHTTDRGKKINYENVIINRFFVAVECVKLNFKNVTR